VRQFLNKPRIACFAAQGVSGYPHVFSIPSPKPSHGYKKTRMNKNIRVFLYPWEKIPFASKLAKVLLLKQIL
jgi:hypothetical protein